MSFVISIHKRYYVRGFRGDATYIIRTDTYEKGTTSAQPAALVWGGTPKACGSGAAGELFEILLIELQPF
jgi:hypothetical protein